MKVQTGPNSVRSYFYNVHRWFRHSKYSSFQRQLNIYGFKRIHQGIDKNAYYHEHFIKGDYHRTLHIERHAIKGVDAVGKLSSSKKDPNFYRTMQSAMSSEDRSLGFSGVVSTSALPVRTAPATFALKMLLQQRQKRGMVFPPTDQQIGLDRALGLARATIPTLTPMYTTGWLAQQSDVTQLSNVLSSALAAGFLFPTRGVTSITESGLSSLLGGDLASYPFRTPSQDSHFSLPTAMPWEVQALLEASRRGNQSWTGSSSSAQRSLSRVCDDHHENLRIEMSSTIGHLLG
jgi:HSF-type DNA-binding